MNHTIINNIVVSYSYLSGINICQSQKLHLGDEIKKGAKRGFLSHTSLSGDQHQGFWEIADGATKIST